MAALLFWWLAVLGGPAAQQPCEAISGQHADGTLVGVVVYGCNPAGVDPPYVLVETR